MKKFKKLENLILLKRSMVHVTIIYLVLESDLMNQLILLFLESTFHL